MYRAQNRDEHSVEGGLQMSAYQKWIDSAPTNGVHPGLHMRPASRASYPRMIDSAATRASRWYLLHCRLLRDATPFLLMLAASLLNKARYYFGTEMMAICEW
jgi:hypothetical protein